MIVGSRECPSCRTTLAEDAAFCHKCGSATPTSIGRATGNIDDPPLKDFPEIARRAAIQSALGDTYEVRRLLGRGGFAEVYVAFDNRLKREIAVKTIRGDLVVNENLLERFQREAEAVAKLRHPNVVPIYSVGESGGVAYFTMPLITGQNLADALQSEGRLSLHESLRILREASNGLHAAHQAGVVHRDVKPDNIMLEGVERSAVVMDFGIAKSAAGDAKGLTGTGMLLGTPHYMSPEQALGEQSLDARSDQYALAVVGYRMLTGRAPFEGNSAQTLMFKTVTEVPPPACEVAPDIPKVISDVLAKALSKAPEDRYSSMAQFASALASFEQPGASAAPSPRARARVDMFTRVRAMRSASMRWQPWALAASALAVTAIALFASATPDLPLQMAGHRDDALFVAKTFLNARGVRAGRDEFIGLVSNDSAFRFLHRQLGLKGAEQRAATDMPVWKWEITSTSAGSRDQWYVQIGPENRVIGFNNPLADTVGGGAIPIDSARALAEHDLLQLGWSLSQLEDRHDSSIVRKARTDRVFRWNVRNGAIPWRNSESAHVQLVATVAGGRVVGIGQRMNFPDGYRESEPPDWIGAAGTLSVVLTTILALVVIVRRQRNDELQWGTVLRVALFVAVGLLVIFAPLAYEVAMRIRSAGNSWFIVLLAVLIASIFLGGIGLCAAVAGESLAFGQKPGMVAGFSDVVRGRLVIPEWANAVPPGYVVGALIALVRALGIVAALRFGIGTPVLPRLPFSTMPFADSMLAPPLLALGIVLAVVFVSAVGRTLRFGSIVGLVAPPVVAGLILYGLGEGAAFVVCESIAVALLTVALWRYGILSALVAVIVAESIERLVVVSRVGDWRYTLGTGALLGILIAPAALAIVASRRYSDAVAGP